MQRRWTLLACALVCVSHGQLHAGTKNGPCSRPEYRQFDFYVGEWDLESRVFMQDLDKRGHWVETKARDRVRVTLNGCVLEEYFEGSPPGVPQRGMSFSMYDAQSGKWRQQWVDDEGNWSSYSGGFQTGQMVLYRERTENGKKILQRQVYFNITSNSFDWSMERSTNGGRSWIVTWTLRYRRR
jgi:hypothetical protein